MKQSDIAALIVVASLSMIAAYFVANTMISGNLEGSEKVKTTKTITEEIEPPDPMIFNKDALNPTVEVVIGDTRVP